jgi:hypothetical protein
VGDDKAADDEEQIDGQMRAGHSSRNARREIEVKRHHRDRR